MISCYLRQVINTTKHFVFSSNFSFSFRVVRFWCFIFVGQEFGSAPWGLYITLSVFVDNFEFADVRYFAYLSFHQRWFGYFFSWLSAKRWHLKLSYQRSIAILKNMMKNWQLHIFDTLNVILLSMRPGWILYWIFSCQPISI